MSSFNRMFKNCLIISLILGIFATNLFAESPKKDQSGKLNDGLIFLMCEGYIAAISGLAVLDPKTQGIVCLALLPVVIGGETMNWQDDFAANLTMVIGYTSIAIYNMSVLRNNKLSDRTVFARNEIGWHALLLTSLTAYWLFSLKASNKTAWNMDLGLHDGNPLLLVSYKF